ncbi:MAG: hypothetical protein UR94_C0024G0027 [Parcubacteria group bacterium GW2011_GWA2_36_10]|nr:MAG: hypothetical protein UR94_C0024G0027 [Parcubacteria group bacterium GW2011_GWA2_36_10]
MLNMQFLNQFLSTISEINGLYLDAKAGFHSVYSRIMEIQEKEVAKGHYSFDELDKVNFDYVKKDIENNEIKLKHRSTVADRKERNKPNGKNYYQIANYCIVLIYQYWEYYRDKTEKSHNIKLDSNLMSDINCYRNSIIHHHSIANKKVNKCKILTWFKYKDEIKIDENKFQTIIEKIKQEIVKMDENYGVQHQIVGS